MKKVLLAIAITGCLTGLGNGVSARRRCGARAPSAPRLFP